ncbi:type IX secretion system membrane protein, PorP/SprF family [Lishizhenia tianjinensis]|uniref:Type IX secretion system membrane protein, PorP/SprF family n=1 Tax=Lishizhenia tianjinensis TaxID=477690 RepID=A0A1I6ZL11_9FLAO|nr:type IX secretion system membrane protein PorP/SprF [Lishizhenia tianjinensis]SFT63408.1 type IX secretion system membrane protein, PorP/SprF family [Lishizhenia tianjinensis]
MYKIIITLIGLLSSGIFSWAQQDPQFTQYFDNTLFINSAYAGSRDMLNVTAIHREQWAGFDGHPRTTTIGMHTPLAYRSVGLGFSAVNDAIGPLNQTMVNLDFSYSLRFKRSKSKLSFGLKAGANIINVNSSELETTTGNDGHLMNNVKNNVNPNFGFGILYHSDRFFVGASIPKLLQNSYDGFSASNIEIRHYYAIIGGVATLSDQWKLRPTAQVKIAEGSPLSVDLSAAFIHSDKIYLGAMYRWDAAAGVFFQIQVNPQFKVGLATDFGVQEIRTYNEGTFELMLSYDFNFNREGIKSPRYF